MTIPRDFRQISSVVEYTDPNTSEARFGLRIEPDDVRWKPLNGSVMLTLTPTELRNLADVIEHIPQEVPFVQPPIPF